MVSLTWSQVGTIIGALVVVMGAFAYHMDRRFDGLRSEMIARFEAVDKRFEDLKLWAQSEFRRLDERIDRLTERIGKIEEKLEQRITSR